MPAQQKPQTKVAPKKGTKGPKKAKATTLKFTIDCSGPVEDSIMELKGFEKYLKDKIKVNGKTGNLQDIVKTTIEKNKIHVTSTQPFSKRYLKYLTKKFLKKNNLRDYLRIVASDKQTYILKYFEIPDDEEEDEAEEK